LVRVHKIQEKYESKHSTHLLFERDDPRLYLLQGEVVYRLGGAVGQVREVCAEVCEKLSRDDKANIFIDHYNGGRKQRVHEYVCWRTPYKLYGSGADGRLKDIILYACHTSNVLKLFNDCKGKYLLKDDQPFKHKRRTEYPFNNIKTIGQHEHPTFHKR
jgi:hypothetical protein